MGEVKQSELDEGEEGRQKQLEVRQEQERKKEELQRKREKERVQQRERQEEVALLREKEKEKMLQKQKELEAQQQKELEARRQTELGTPEEKELEAQEEKEQERKQHAREQQIQKEREEQREQEEAKQRKHRERKEKNKQHREMQELKAGRQKEEKPLSADLRKKALSIAQERAAALSNSGKPPLFSALLQEQLAEMIIRQRNIMKEREGRWALREQRRIRWREDTPGDSTPETPQEEATAAPVTRGQEESVTTPAKKQERAESLEAQEPAKSVSPAQSKSKPKVEESIKQIETELIQEHQRVWETAGPGTPESKQPGRNIYSFRHPLQLSRTKIKTQRHFRRKAKLSGENSPTPTEHDSSDQFQVQAPPSAKAKEAIAPLSVTNADVVGIAMRPDIVHKERANNGP